MRCRVQSIPEVCPLGNSFHPNSKQLKWQNDQFSRYLCLAHSRALSLSLSHFVFFLSFSHTHTHTLALSPNLPPSFTFCSGDYCRQRAPRCSLSLSLSLSCCGRDWICLRCLPSSSRAASNLPLQVSDLYWRSPKVQRFVVPITAMAEDDLA